MPSPTTIWRGATDLIEQAGSPAWDFQDKASVTRIFKGPYATCLASRPPNGAFGVGAYAGLWVVQSSVIRADKGGIGTLTYKMEGLTATDNLPPDECGVEMSQLEFTLEKHPRYDGLSINAVEKVRAYINATDAEQRATVYNSMTVALTQELADKMLRGQTHFIMYVPIYEWKIHTYLAPVINQGGYPQVPFGPVTPPTGWDWLRRGDVLRWTGHFWELTRSWIGAEEWDPDIYPV